MIWLLLHPYPSPISKLDRRYTGRLGKRHNLLTGEGRGGGAKLYDCERDWFSRNHAILSGIMYIFTL
jgi:hypothetical protein